MMGLGSILFSINFATSIVAAILAVSAFPYRESKSIRMLIGMSLGYLFLSFCTVNILGTGELASKAFWSRMSFIALAYLPVSYLIFFSIVVSRWSWLRKPLVLAFLYSGPTVVTAITLNPAWQDSLIRDFSHFNFYGADVVKYTYGPALNFHLTFAYGALILFFALCALVILRDQGVIRKQAILLGSTMLLTLSVDVYAIFTGSPLDWGMVPTVFYGLNLFAIFYSTFFLDLAHMSTLARRRVFDLIPDPVIVTDASDRLITFNNAAEKVFSLKAGGRVRGESNLLTDVLNRDLLVPGEHKVSSGTFGLNVSSVLDRKDVPLGRLYFYRDLTEQKEAEHKTRELLEFSNEMLSLMSHDLSGNLNVQARLSGRVTEVVPSSSRDLGAALLEAATSSRDLVNNLVNWGRSLAPGLGMSISRPYELNVLCEEAIEVMTPIANAREVRFDFVACSDPVLLKGDSGVVSSVVRNLISNAVRASESGQRVRIEVHQSSDEGCVCVFDDGAGMSAQKIANLFSPNSEEAQAERTFGYGIGLRVSQKFLERQNGRLELVSEPSKGTLAKLVIRK